MSEITREVFVEVKTKEPSWEEACEWLKLNAPPAEFHKGATGEVFEMRGDENDGHWRAVVNWRERSEPDATESPEMSRERAGE